MVMLFSLLTSIITTHNLDWLQSFVLCFEKYYGFLINVEVVNKAVLYFLSCLMLAVNEKDITPCMLHCHRCKCKISYVTFWT